MKRILFLSMIALLQTACSFTHHMPKASVDSERKDQIVVMEVGEKRKVMSKQIFSEFNMGFLMPPAFYMQSSNQSVIKIDGSNEKIAWVEALQVGQADILYKWPSGLKTIIKVIPAKN